MERTTFEVAFCDLKLEVLDANVDVAICDLRDSCQLEHEIGWEPINIALDLFVEALCGYPIEGRKIRVEQHPMTAKYENRSADLINGNRGRAWFFRHSREGITEGSQEMQLRVGKKWGPVRSPK